MIDPPMKGLNDMKRILITTALIFLSASPCSAATCKPKKPSQTNIKYQISNLKSQRADPNTCPPKKPTIAGGEIDDILTRLRAQTTQLKSYQAEIQYLFIQDPELLDSQTLRKGMLYYKKDESGSKLRVSFNTLKQDDGAEEKYIEHFIFDGIWLTKIDYQLEKVDFYQQAPEDKPIDVFEFISHRFPLLGFTNTPLLRNQFHITLVPPKEAKSGNFKSLRLTPKKGSIYKDDYAHIEFSLDTATFLPAKIAAESTEGDIFDIQLLESRVNKKIENAVFKLETPKHFSQNIAPLKKK
jgi:outer membrane lipoprotein-sorting protein